METWKWNSRRCARCASSPSRPTTSSSPRTVLACINADFSKSMRIFKIFRHLHDSHTFASLKTRFLKKQNFTELWNLEIFAGNFQKYVKVIRRIFETQFIAKNTAKLSVSSERSDPIQPKTDQTFGKNYFFKLEMLPTSGSATAAGRSRARASLLPESRCMHNL